MRRTAAALLASAAIHAVLFALLLRAPAPPARGAEDVTVDLVETAPPAAAPPPSPAPEPAAPTPPRAPPRRVAIAPPDAPPPPARVPDDLPPPPNAPPPEGAPPPGKAPVRIGVALSATTESGGVAAPVGNTLYGRMPGVAPAPDDVRAYRAERYVPPTRVTVLPKPLAFEIPAAEYPPEPRRLGIEGPVVLMLLVDERGRVVDARVLSEPAPGFRDAAIRSAKAHARFEPGRVGDERVTTWIRYTIRYELP